MSRPFLFVLVLLYHSHYQLLHFPTCLLPGEVAFLSLTLPTDVFSSDLVILESPGCITLASSKELPILLRSIWDTIALLDPSAGAYGEHFPHPSSTSGWCSTCRAPIGVPVLYPGVWWQPALTAKQPLGETFASRKNTRQKVCPHC